MAEGKDDRELYSEFACPKCGQRFTVHAAYSLSHYHAGHGDVRCTPVERKK